MVEHKDLYPIRLLKVECEFPELMKPKNNRLRVYLESMSKDFRGSNVIIQREKDIEMFINRIIPEEYFGTKNNKKLFFKLVRRLTAPRKKEVIQVSLLTKDFEGTFNWVKSLENEKNFHKLLKEVNLYLLERCIKPFLRHRFFYIKQGKSYKIDLVPRNVWQSFRDRIMNEMRYNKYFEYKEDYVDFVPRGALRILPKCNYDVLKYRVIIHYYSKHETTESYNYICSIKQKIKNYVKEKKLHSEIHTSWNDFVKKSSFKRIYGVKADIKDSFGSIDIAKLSWLIQKIPKRILTAADKNFIIQHVEKQYVSVGYYGQEYVIRWCHGLLQGDRLSALLCDLYYLQLIDIGLLKECMVGNYFFHRKVDDYIFCSTEKNRVSMFMSLLQSKNVLNEEKIFSNLIDNRLVELPYCGYIINIQTKEITIEFKMNVSKFRNKFQLWNKHLYNCPSQYLSAVMKFSLVNYYFSKVVFNTNYNNEETIVKIYFQCMIYLAMKFNIAFTELKYYHREYCRNAPIITDKILGIIRGYIRRTEKILEAHRGNLFHGEINKQMLMILGVRAFILVLQIYSLNYKMIICLLKEKVAQKIPLFGGLDVSVFKIPTSMLKKEIV